MHSPIVFACTADATNELKELQEATSQAKVIEALCWADNETLMNWLEDLAGADWMPGLEDLRGWGPAEDLLANLGGTFTPVNEHWGWFEVPADTCRSLLEQALKAAGEWFGLSLTQLEAGLNPVVAYPTITGDIPDWMYKKARGLENLVDEYGFSSRRISGGLYLAVVNEYGGVQVEKFGALVKDAVADGRGIRLAVARQVVGDYHY